MEYDVKVSEYTITALGKINYDYQGSVTTKQGDVISLSSDVAKEAFEVLKEKHQSVK